MTPEVGEVLITAEAIAARVRELGRTLSRHYAGREPVLVAIMKGCVLFLADLVRAWPGAMDLEFVSAQSYDGAEAGDLRLALPPDLAKRVAGRPVIVVDDIYDTGRTLTAACRAIESLGAAEVRTIVLLQKTRPAAPGAPPDEPADDLRRPDWIGFEVPDQFVVGYGLDYHGRYRNLPHVAVLTGYTGSAAPGPRRRP
jgi:hypoxanthine phosphoribosyltransferase